MFLRYITFIEYNASLCFASATISQIECHRLFKFNVDSTDVDVEILLAFEARYSGTKYNGRTFPFSFCFVSRCSSHLKFFFVGTETCESGFSCHARSRATKVKSSGT